MDNIKTVADLLVANQQQFSPMSDEDVVAIQNRLEVLAAIAGIQVAPGPVGTTYTRRMEHRGEDSIIFDIATTAIRYECSSHMIKYSSASNFFVEYIDSLIKDVIDHVKHRPISINRENMTQFSQIVSACQDVARTSRIACGNVVILPPDDCRKLLCCPTISSDDMTIISWEYDFGTNIVAIVNGITVVSSDQVTDTYVGLSKNFNSSVIVHPYVAYPLTPGDWNIMIVRRSLYVNQSTQYRKIGD